MKNYCNVGFSCIKMYSILLCSILAMHDGYTQAASFVYRPPNRGTAQNTAGGATRGIVYAAVPPLNTLENAVQVLVPKHIAIALTSSSQPRLYWYLRPGVRDAQRFQISLAHADTPLLNVPLPVQMKGGIQSLDLAEHGLRLNPDVAYRWQVSLEPLRKSNAYQNTSTVTSSGMIKLTEADPGLRDAAPDRRPYLAASHGLWYDALDGVSQLVNQGHKTAHWRKQRAVLLEQANLTAAAEYDSEMADKSRNKR